jgi:hypothetical protein
MFSEKVDRPSRSSGLLEKPRIAASRFLWRSHRHMTGARCGARSRNLGPCVADRLPWGGGRRATLLRPPGLICRFGKDRRWAGRDRALRSQPPCGVDRQTSQALGNWRVAGLGRRQAGACHSNLCSYSGCAGSPRNPWHAWRRRTGNRGLDGRNFSRS